MSTRDTDYGAKAILAEIEKVKKKPFVKVGILGSSGMHQAEKEGDAPVTVVDVAVFNEYGTTTKLGNVGTPERPFIRTTHDEKEQTINNYIDQGVDQIFAGNMKVVELLSKTGVMVQAFIKSKINAITDPRNAPSTIAEKGSSKPLIDTGQMRNSVNFEVVMSGVDSDDDATSEGGE